MGRLSLKRMRSTATTKKIPTPTATVQMRTLLGIEGTWLARTTRSGSAIVIIIPMTRQINARTGRSFTFIICAPTPSPSGVIAISAPSWKNAMPMMSIKAPTRNRAIVPVFMGTTKMLKSSTITVIGSTALTDSSIFSFSFLFKILFKITSHTF